VSHALAVRCPDCGSPMPDVQEDAGRSPACTTPACITARSLADVVIDAPRVAARSAVRAVPDRCLLDRVAAWAWEEPPTRRSTFTDWLRAPGPVVIALAAITPLVLVLSWLAGWITFGLIVVAAIWVRIGADAVLVPQAARTSPRPRPRRDS
jgi:hypothetical protein